MDSNKKWWHSTSELTSAWRALRKQQPVSLEVWGEYAQFVKKRIGKTLLPLTTILGIDNSSVMVSPERWWTIVSLKLRWREIFYDNALARNNQSEALREWFWMGPQAGPLSETIQQGLGSKLKRHWFLRDLPWQILSSNSNSITLGLESNAETMEQFPFVFQAEQLITLVNRDTATISITVHNTGSKPMPFAPWHHTFYKVAPEEKHKVRLTDTEGQEIINPEEKSKRFSGEGTVKIPNTWTLRVFIPWTWHLELNFDEKFGEIRLWTEKDSGFVCIEPVICNPQNWETKAMIINPHESLNLRLSIQLR